MDPASGPMRRDSLRFDRVSGTTDCAVTADHVAIATFLLAFGGDAPISRRDRATVATFRTTVGADRTTFSTLRATATARPRAIEPARRQRLSIVSLPIKYPGGPDRIMS